MFQVTNHMHTELNICQLSLNEHCISNLVLLDTNIDAVESVLKFDLHHYIVNLLALIHSAVLFICLCK